MKIVIEVVGTSPLLMHNPRMVDPEFEINRQMKVLYNNQRIERLGLRGKK